MAISGAQGSFIGRPANVVIIDDPHAGAQEAKSALQRQRIWEWCVAVLRSRLTPPGAIVLVMSRWHEDDLSGRALENAKKGGDQWEYLNLPALAEENDPLDPPRAVGEPLWPGRYDIPWLEDTQRALGSYYFSAQYQGRPTPDVGGMFERAGLRTFAEDADNYILHNPEKPDEFIPKRQVAKFAIVDPAFGENEGNDYTAIGIFGQLKDNRLLVLHIDRGRRQGEDIAVKTIDLARAWDCQWIGVEDVAAQRWLAQMIANRGFRAVKKIRAAGSKEQRAQPAVIAWNNGDIYCAQAEWLDEFMEELAGFDKAAHDDQVDVLSYAALQMVKGGNRPQGVRPIEIGRRTSPWAI
jgi:predicted phage terminase large subunit-like protein